MSLFFRLSVILALSLVVLTKGVLTTEEGRAVSAGGTSTEQRDRLAALLRDKGLISAAEFEAIRTVAPSA